ncbi:MAG: hypothetical protein ACK5IB_02515 [Qingshengfaniella sp.]
MLALGGILAGQTGQEVGFGRARDGAVAAVSRMAGAGPVWAGGCGGIAERARYPGGLTLYFTPEAFVGWSVDPEGRNWQRAGGVGNSAGRVCEIGLDA